MADQTNPRPEQNTQNPRSGQRPGENLPNADETRGPSTTDKGSPRVDQEHNQDAGMQADGSRAKPITGSNPGTDARDASGANKGNERNQGGQGGQDKSGTRAGR